MKKLFFSYSSDQFEFHSTEAEAKARFEEGLQDCRDYADPHEGDSSEEVAQLCWGEVMQRGQMTRRMATEEEVREAFKEEAMSEAAILDWVGAWPACDITATPNPALEIPPTGPAS